MSLAGAVRRMPVRLRVTLAFAGAMAVLLAVTGVVVHVRFAGELDREVDQGLRHRADDVTALLRRSGGRLPAEGDGTLIEPGESFAQVLDARTGAVLDASPQVRNRPLVEAREAREGPVLADLEEPPVGDDPLRVLARPAHVAGRDVVVVVAGSVEETLEAQEDLASILLTGGVVTLLLVSVAGYAAITAALRPVEAIRRRAAHVSAGPRGQRVPLPAARDELHRLGETLNAMLARLEAAFERERRFVADASHELRTPLAVLRTELDLALRGPRTPQELHAALRSAAEEAERLGRLADDLLVVARAEDGRLPVHLEDVDAARLLHEVRDRFAARASQAGTTVDAEAPAGLRLRADPLRLDQALGNLVDNALRHGAGPVRLTARTEDGHVVLAVADAGPGFPEGFAARAFERFSRADAARGRPGAGLGLAIVDLVARAHGGTAGIAPAAARAGAEVWVRLPTRDAR